MEIYQISVFLENQTGKLFELTELLSKNGIDLRAINIAETSDYGVLRVITKDSQKTVDVLNANGFIAARTPVVVVGVKDEPGGLTSLLHIFAEEKFDVEYMYSIFGQPNGLAYMVLRVDNVQEVRNMLKKHNIYVAECADLGIY